MSSVFSPGWVAIALGLLIPLVPKGKARKGFLLLIPILSYLYLLYLRSAVGVEVRPEFELLGYTMFPVYIDALSFAFGTVFHIALLLGLIFALHVDDWTQHVAATVYAGGAIGAVFAGDLVTLFIYWELIAFASAFLIWARRTKRAYKTGQRYLIWQIVSGLLLLAGILVRADAGLGIELGTIELGSPGSLLIFVAFGIKCAWPGLHCWLSDAYPEATPTGAVFLSAFTTKLAVYALARCFAGNEELIWIGAGMAGFPIFFAVIENDMRRVLAYSLINQVGFMVVGIGVGTELAINGATAHAFADVLFKGLLFMTMGAVLHRTGKIHASDLGGLYKAMPFTAVCCLVGAASISAFPLFSAFATKGLIMDAAANNGHAFVWFVLLFAAAGVFHHAGIKIPFFAFFGHDSGLRPKSAPLNMKIAMGLGAFGCIAIGCYPWALYDMLPHPGALADYHVYSFAHVLSQLQILFFSALAFVTLMLTGLYPPELHSVNLDADWLIRRPLRAIWRVLIGGFGRIARGVQTLCLESIPRSAAQFVESYGSERGALRGRGPLGSSVLVVMILLVVYLAFSLGLVPKP
ncbi:MAG: Na(+)/H(+) antiporter subunit D [Planctomycetes bacterium]|nr:Na(+)/H(+) antiporter subunit D [Planctomycetota bacterium]